MQNFYNEIDLNIRRLLDAAVEGALMQRTADDAKSSIKRMGHRLIHKYQSKRLAREGGREEPLAEATDKESIRRPAKEAK